MTINKHSVYSILPFLNYTVKQKFCEEEKVESSITTIDHWRKENIATLVADVGDTTFKRRRKVKQ